MDGNDSILSTDESDDDEYTKPRNIFNMSLTNARSLIHKLESLNECNNELRNDVILITETWMRDDQYTNDLVRDFEDKNDYSIIRKDRAHARGGGVAICYNKDTICMTRARLPYSQFEVLAAIGRRTGQRRKVCVLVLYLPPWYPAERSRKCLEYVSDCIVLLRSRYENPYMFVGGDLNKRNFRQALQDFPDLKVIQTPPTRGDNVLDLIATNSERDLVQSGVTHPIVDANGVESDHRVVYLSIKMPRVPAYTVNEYSYRKIEDNGVLKFGEWVARQDWTRIRSIQDVDEQVEALHEAFEKGMNEAFPFRTRKKKSTEPVWMTDEIRSLIATRRKLFRRMKRKGRWKEIKALVAKKVKDRKEGHSKYVRDKFTKDKCSKNFYRSINAIMRGCEQEAWDVRTLFDGKSDVQIAESLAEFFNKISEEYNPLQDEEIPNAYSNERPPLTTEQVRNRLLKLSKPTSTVPGDLPPVVYKHYAESLAVPITGVFNNVIKNFDWPQLWKTEYVSVIPKNTSPESVDNCRNIACTNFLSKVLESFVLDWAREEVPINSNQYGGQPGCGPAHFLTELNDYVTTSLEDNRAAVVLTSMDFSKAFNRLSHQSCLQEFQKKGASSQVMRLVACFLQNRQMTVRVGQVRSKPRQVTAGAPQGSVLGCFLFNVGIDTIEDGCNYDSGVRIEREHLGRTDDYPASSTPSRVTPSQETPDLSPIREEPSQDFEVLPRVANAPPWLRKAKDPRWKPKEPMKIKFVDDGAHVAKVNMREQRLMMRGGKMIKTIHDQASQSMFDHVVGEAERRGMKVNKKKTALVCISTATSHTAEAILYDDTGTEIKSQDSVKLLGYTMDSDGGPKTHIKNIIDKMRKRIWALTKLKSYGFNSKELISVYTTFMRPLVEHVGVVWHSQITAEQAAALEKQQTRALRHIFGFGLSARRMLEESGLKSLAKRRETALRKFALKCQGNPRFQRWFPEREPSRYARRSIGYKNFWEPNARTDRYRNSPLNTMRRMLNGTK